MNSRRLPSGSRKYARAIATERSGLHRDAMAREVRDRAIDGTGPFEAEIAVPRRDRDPRDRGRPDLRCVHVQLLLTDAIEGPPVALDHLRTDDVAIERVGAAPVGHRDDDMVEARAHGRSLRRRHPTFTAVCIPRA